MAKIDTLSREVEKIKERNSRVEGDKAWETSFTRRAIIAIGTYLVSAVFLVAINSQYPLLVAFVPVLGFLLSSLTLPLFKEWWFGSRKSA
ncbi:hypothetical protein H0O00_00540 [Candidatus Micrarchaeota archaeon]|nr:hypothetical protein [Candidatus Micrarchaeota archaeon]